jgi:mono/diheme cytochrome c family protein
LIVAVAIKNQLSLTRKRGRGAALACASGSLLALLAGCDLAGKPNPDDRAIPGNQVRSFAVLYKDNCAGCHGADGKLGPAPPLNDKIFLDGVPNDVLLEVITDGRMGTPMPAFAHEQGGMLTAEQVKVLAEGIKPHWGGTAEPRPGLPSYLTPKGAKGNREAGVKLFATACAGCHGERGQGGTNDERPAGAINDPAFLSLISDQALRRLIITGRPDLGMPHYSSPLGRPPSFQPLTSQDISDLVALLAYWRQGGSANP